MNGAKFFLLSCRDDQDDVAFTFDDFFRFVVRAQSEDEARQAVASWLNGVEENSEYWGGDHSDKASRWLNPSVTSCVEVPADGPPAVILDDFHPG